MLGERRSRISTNSQTRPVAARQGENGRRAEMAHDAIVEQMHLQTRADEARGHRVKNAPQADRAEPRHRDGCHREVGGAVRRQGSERFQLDRHRARPPGVLARDRLGEKRPISRKVGEVARASHRQGFPDRALEVAVGGLDRTVLEGKAGIVARELWPNLGDAS